jgi:hypothetical protein
MFELPEHFPIPVTEDGHGPADPAVSVRTQCWCGNPRCMLFYGNQGNGS